MFSGAIPKIGCRGWSVVVALAVLLAGSLVPAEGAARSRRGQTSRPSTKAAQIPAVDTQALDKAIAELRIAREDFNRADDAFTSLIKRMREAFEASAPMTAALAEVKAAEAEYEAASKPVLAAVALKPEYKAAVQAREQAEQQIAELRKANAPPDQIAPLAAEALKQGTAAKEIEIAAVNADPAAGNAKDKLTAAGQKVAALRAQFEQSLARNADFIAAKKAFDEAQAKLTAAEAHQRAVAAKTAAQQAAHDEAVARQDKYNREHGH